MNKKRFAKMLFLGLKRMRDPFYQGFAAQLSFYFLLSIVPILIVLSQILSFFDVSPELFTNIINKYVSGPLGDYAREWLQLSTHRTSNFVLILLALWAGSRAQFAMMRISNFTMSAGKFTGNYFTERIRSMKTMILTLLTISFALIVIVYGKSIIDLTLLAINAAFGIKYRISTIWYFLRWPIAGALYFLMVSYNYYVMSYQKVKFRELIPGSIFASVGMLIVTVVYAAYASHVLTGSYNIIYGSLASIVALMIWFYFLAWVLSLGVLTNKVWMDTSGKKID